MDHYRDQTMGTLYINVHPEDKEKITAYLDNNKVVWKEEIRNV